jgi:RimJ/RimL family protein N-acetyltransferase
MVEGTKVLLRAWSTADLDVLHRMRNDLSLQRQLMSHPRGNSLDQVRDWLVARTKATDSVFLVIEPRHSSEIAGYIQASEIDCINGLAKIGICLTPSLHGKGFGSEAMALLESYLTAVFNIRKLTLEVLADNAIAIALYTKLGYRDVGHLQQHFYFDGDYFDVALMEKLIRS